MKKKRVKRPKPQREPGQHLFNMSMGAQYARGTMSRLMNPQSTHDTSTINPFVDAMNQSGADGS